MTNRAARWRAARAKTVIVEKRMLRYALLAVVIVAASGLQAKAQETGRYQVVTVPLGIEGENGGTTILLDTRTGRTWHVTLDDKGRPRWRGIDFAGGSQGLAEAADGRQMAAEPQAGAAGAAEEPQVGAEPEQQQN
jgi:hypothetical protein